jgi:hypothetical protein
VVARLSIFKSNIIIIAISALILALSVGCASHDAAVSGSHESRKIVDFIIQENPASLILGIRGNQKLIYMEDRQLESKKLVLYFPATGLKSVRGRFVPPNNEIISSIIATERAENETTNSTVYIALKLDSPYVITPDKNGLRVTFSKRPTFPEKIQPQQKPSKKKPDPQPPKPAKQNAPAATVLRAVKTEPFENSVAVNIKADGTIKKYKTFTLINPDRIVFDLYNLKSPRAKEQKIAVQSKWIKRIRYFGHPHKLRLVIETLNSSLSNYSSVSTDSGLLIHVGAK